VIDGNKSPFRALFTTQNEVWLSGLLPGTLYHVAVSALRENREGEEKIITVWTPIEGAPSVYKWSVWASYQTVLFIKLTKLFKIFPIHMKTNFTQLQKEASCFTSRFYCN